MELLKAEGTLAEINPPIVIVGDIHGQVSVLANTEAAYIIELSDAVFNIENRISVSALPVFSTSIYCGCSVNFPKEISMEVCV